MPSNLLSRPVAAIVVALAVLALLPASGAALDLRGLFGSKRLEAQAVAVDAAAAVRLLSDYRRKHGLGPVTLDKRLTGIAADHAKKMATLDRVAHVLRGEGSFARRLSAGGYDAAAAAENIGAGYDTLAEAFAGWRKSREHDRNLLRPEMTAIGIARADSAGSRYGSYWSLVLARPYEGPPPGGPDAGPVVGVRP